MHACKSLFCRKNTYKYNFISRYLRVRKSSPAHLQDPFLFSVLARKEKRFLHSKEKRAPMRVTFPQEAAACPQLSDCRGAIVERAVAPVSARSRFAWRCLGRRTIPKQRRERKRSLYADGIVICYRVAPELYHVSTIAMPSHRAVQRFIALAPFLSSTARPKGLASRRGAVFLSARRKKDRGAHYAGYHL